ncbi:hypothetical protein [Ureibacillus terrenus]|uniref:hypothetical protein n=1 Tax=Ureibacillus terrenus TaxID=118246 RepID=UPI002E1DE2C4|nr:hypothetical protein [Ureibacillus terrenus]MED3765157.1 hypothetical protein [Ureibacillus terrenus]
MASDTGNFGYSVRPYFDCFVERMNFGRIVDFVPHCNFDFHFDFAPGQSADDMYIDDDGHFVRLVGPGHVDDFARLNGKNLSFCWLRADCFHFGLLDIVD